MKKYIITALAFATMLVGSATFTACDDVDDVKDLTLDRVLSPTSLTGRIRNNVDIELSWDAMSKAESYEIEVFREDPEFAGQAIATASTENTTYTVTGLEGETSYNIRVRSISKTIAASKWSTITNATNPEQIMEAVAEDDLTAFSVTLHWLEGATATEIVVTPGDITHIVTADEIAAGQATVDGLQAQTAYTAKLMNGTKTRGTATFTTRIDLGGATQIEEGADLAAVLDNATEDENFVIMSGTFNLGDYAVTKPISIRGYSENSKPTINGRFTVSGAVASINLANLIFSGETTRGNLIDASAGQIQSVILSGCTIEDYKNQVIYINAGTVNSVTFENCTIDGIGNGGDGLVDARKNGSISSLTVKNSTFSNGCRTFMRIDQITSSDYAALFENCTFYKVCNQGPGNNNGLFYIRGVSSTLTVKNCLFYGIGGDLDTSTNANAAVWMRTSYASTVTTTYSTNYFYSSPYLWNGVPNNNTATEADPQFVNAENGDFTIANQDMIDNNVGDPRWIK